MQIMEFYVLKNAPTSVRTDLLESKSDVLLECITPLNSLNKINMVIVSLVDFMEQRMCASMAAAPQFGNAEPCCTKMYFRDLIILKLYFANLLLGSYHYCLIISVVRIFGLVFVIYTYEVKTSAQIKKLVK